MGPRALRFLALAFLLLITAFLQPPSVAVASTDCDMVCWEQFCPNMYYNCLDSGGTSESCCTGANWCAGVCGPECPLFCLE